MERGRRNAGEGGGCAGGDGKEQRSGCSKAPPERGGQGAAHLEVPFQELGSAVLLLQRDSLRHPLPAISRWSGALPVSMVNSSLTPRRSPLEKRHSLPVPCWALSLQREPTHPILQLLGRPRPAPSSFAKPSCSRMHSRGKQSSSRDASPVLCASHSPALMAFLIVKRSCDTTHAFEIMLHHTRVQNFTV